MMFPKTIAHGDAFCNREDERQRLRHHIENTQHTIVVSPRRYGKTSLILKIIEEMGWPNAHVDLFLAFDEKIIVERFLDGIAKLVAQLVPLNIKALGIIRDFFKLFSISLTAGDVSVGLKLESAQSSHANTIKNAIEGLENLLIKQKKRAIFFIDEMQDIVDTSICGEIEAAIRFYAQKTKHLAFVFSGSNRKLLKEIFDDRKRPLFKMCDQINLQRIKQEDYIKFINRAATLRWGQELSNESMSKIFELTERHPYYLNYLCSHIWQLKSLPTEHMIHDTWSNICSEDKNSISFDLNSLSVKQKKILRYVAEKGLLNNPTAHEHLQGIKLTARGMLQSIKGLIENDWLEETPDGIHVTDPLLKSILLD